VNTIQDKGDARWTRTRQRLLEGGRQAFAERGVEASTVLEIVRAAGVSQPSFYNHFESKEQLAQEIAADYFRIDRAAKLAVFEQVEDPAEAIAINIAQTLAIATNDPVIAWTLVKSESLRDLVISSTADPLVAMIEEGTASGRFKVTSAHTIALALRGAALAMVQDILRGSADDNAAVYFQELVLRMLGLSVEESSDVVARSRTRPAERQTKKGLGAVA
jgi:AcrR family transcriptional regulator